MARCFCACHQYPGTYPPPCGYCGHDTREGRMVGGINDGWEPNADDDIQVTIHGKYGRGPMPVEFRDAMAEMVRLVKQAIDDGTLPKRARDHQRAGEG